MDLTQLKLDGLHRTLDALENRHGRWRVVLGIARIFEHEHKPVDIVQRTAYCRNNETQQHDYYLAALDSDIHREQTDTRLVGLLNDFNPDKPLALVFTEKRGHWRGFEDLRELSKELREPMIHEIREAFLSEMQRQELESTTAQGNGGAAARRRL